MWVSMWVILKYSWPTRLLYTDSSTTRSLVTSAHGTLPVSPTLSGWHLAQSRYLDIQSQSCTRLMRQCVLYLAAPGLHLLELARHADNGLLHRLHLRGCKTQSCIHELHLISELGPSALRYLANRF